MTSRPWSKSPNTRSSVHAARSDLMRSGAFRILETPQTMEDRVDPNTGLSTKVITASKQAKDRRPTIIIRDAHGKPMLRPRGNEARYSLPEGAYLNAEESP